MIDENILQQEEKISLNLRKLYSSYGYGCYKMSKFEEYDLYSNNKNFLLSDSVITFTDTNGKMMALKPDMTLSIAKNTNPQQGDVLKMYYDENVYRVSSGVGRYKEINQVGLECIGELSDYNFFEVLSLACLSLKKISDDSLLTISDLGVISSVLNRISGDTSLLLKCISQKNKQGVLQFCENNCILENDAEILSLLAEPSKDISEILSLIKACAKDEKVVKAIVDLEKFASLCQSVTGVKVMIDLSLVGDLNYYNGLIFNGFIKGVPNRVLSGGRYDKLMEKLGKRSFAIGFAVYLDLLERLNAKETLDADIVLIYDDSNDVKKVFERVRELSKSGKRVIALKNIPDNFTYNEVVRFN